MSNYIVRKRLNTLAAQVELSRAIEEIDTSKMTTGEVFKQNAKWLFSEYNLANVSILYALEHLKAGREGVVSMEYAVRHAIASLSDYDPENDPTIFTNNSCGHEPDEIPDRKQSK